MTESKFTNNQLAIIFRNIGDILEIKGEVIYKILAYRRAADSLETLGEDINTVWREDRLTEVPGVGKAIAEKIEELLSTGKLEFYEKLKTEVPPGLVEVLEVPDLGPKKAALFWKQLGITNVTELEAAAREGKLRDLPGMGEKSEAKIIVGIESLKRRSDRIPLGRAWPYAEGLLAWLRDLPGVNAAEAGGSLRRMRATVGDLDLLVASSDSATIMRAFTGRPDVIRVQGHGPTKSSVEFQGGLRAQLWVHPIERFGTALVYATGSKDHNVRLRELALKKGLSLSEHSFERKDGTEVLCETEEEVYAVLGLPWIPPEMREDRGEVQLAMKNKLPPVLQLEEMRSELHCHSTYSDGKLSIREMAEAARARGKKVLAFTDHSSSLGVVGGMKPEDVLRQREEINSVQQELGDSIRLLQGVELEILADGRMDFPDEVLAELDIVFASMHTGLRQPRETVTMRTLNAIRNPHVDVIAHPTGRMIPNREGADLDMEALFSAAREHGTALEINAHPSRLDLDDVYSRRAVEMGIPITINTDAHSASDLDLLHFGIATARRGWVTPQSVINTWDDEKLLTWLNRKG